jgi:hypothetical protein
MGLDNRAFLRGMDEVERVTNETTRRMVARHRTQIDDNKRREWQQARRRQKFQQDFARGWQVATVAAAAGIATVVSTLDAAADRSPVIRRQLDDISAAAKEMRANIGEDLFGLGGPGMADAIRNLERIRSVAVDFTNAAFGGIASLFSGGGLTSGFVDSMANSAQLRADREADRMRRLRFEQEQNLIQMRLQLRAGVGGDVTAQRQLQARTDRDRINAAAANGGLSRAGIDELRTLIRTLRDNALASMRSVRLGDERDAIELGRAELNAEKSRTRNPFGTGAQEQLELLRKRIELRKQSLRIQKDELLSEEEKASILQQLQRLYGEQTRARIEAIRREANERRRARDNRVSDSLAGDRIGRLRATGQGRLAEVESLFLGFQQRRRDLENDRELTGEQRGSLLSSGASLLRAQLRELRRGRIDTFIEAGLAGGAALRRQILGADGTGGAADSPIVSRIDEIIERMDRIITGGGTTAVAAP